MLGAILSGKRCAKRLSIWFPAGRPVKPSMPRAHEGAGRTWTKVSPRAVTTSTHASISKSRPSFACKVEVLLVCTDKPPLESLKETSATARTPAGKSLGPIKPLHKTVLFEFLIAHKVIVAKDMLTFDLVKLL